MLVSIVIGLVVGGVLTFFRDRLRRRVRRAGVPGAAGLVQDVAGLPSRLRDPETGECL